MPKAFKVVHATAGALVLWLLIPVICAWGGSTNLVNWGPCLVAAGIAACFLAIGRGRSSGWGLDGHALCFALVMVFFGVRALSSDYRSQAGADFALILLGLLGYFAARSATDRDLRHLAIGLTLTALLNAVCVGIQMQTPEWNLLYPGRSANFPSGLFAHYSYAATFSLGTVGFLLSQCHGASARLKTFLIAGIAASSGSVLVSHSRGGILAFCLMVVVTFFLLLLKAFRERKAEWVWLVIGYGVAVFWFLGKMAVTQVYKLRSGADEFASFADGGRMDFQQAALRLTWENPFLGGGAGSFGRDVFRAMDAALPAGVEPGMAHNELLQAAVDYGWIGVAGLLLVFAWPVVSVTARFVTSSKWDPAVWSAVGLVGMVLESNFESVFHCAPCVFIGGLLLGAATRREWQDSRLASATIPMGGPAREIEVYRKRGALALADSKEGIDGAWIGAVANYSQAYLSGDFNSGYQVLDAIALSPDTRWQRRGFTLATALNAANRQAIDELVTDIAALSAREIAKPRYRHWYPRHWLNTAAGWLTVSRNTAFALVALASLAAGAHLSRSLFVLWQPLYRASGMAAAARFSMLAAELEHSPWLGLQKLAAEEFRQVTYEFETTAYREYWAENMLPLLLKVTPDRVHDPALALLVANAAGWAGDEELALSLHDVAIRVQRHHESVFLAHYFKGEYLCEMAISAEAGGDLEKAKDFAKRALECFERSDGFSDFKVAERDRLIGECQRILQGNAPG